MVILTDFLAELKAIPTVASNVADRLVPVLAKTTEDTFIVYTPRGGEREAFYRDSFGLAIYRIQIDIYSKTFSLNQTIYDSIYDKFNGFSGELNSNTVISKSIIINYTNLFSDTDGDFYRTTFDIEITF